MSTFQTSPGLRLRCLDRDQIQTVLTPTNIYQVPSLCLSPNYNCVLIFLAVKRVRRKRLPTVEHLIPVPKVSNVYVYYIPNSDTFY